MKKLKIITLLILLCNASVYSNNSKVSSAFAQTPIERIKDSDVSIQIQSTYTRIDEEKKCRNEACERDKKEAFRAASLNLIPFGYGSFLQEDKFGGFSIAVVDSVSLGLVLFGLSEQNTRNGGWGSAMMLSLAGLGFLLGRIIGFTAPFLHYNDYIKSKNSSTQGKETHTPQQQTQYSSTFLNFEFAF